MNLAVEGALKGPLEIEEKYPGLIKKCSELAGSKTKMDAYFLAAVFLALNYPVKCHHVLVPGLDSLRVSNRINAELRRFMKKISD